MAEPRTFVIVGASLAGATAATTLRDEGFDGRIVLIGAEEALPYERPGLSKAYLRGEETKEDLLVRPEEWYGANDVDLRLGVQAGSLDLDGRKVNLVDGDAVPFDALLLATGSRNRRPSIPGSDLENVLDLRRIADADRIRAAAAEGGPAVLIGMGFIGSEVAASLRALDVDVTVVDPGDAPMGRALGPDAAQVMAEIHADHGVKMRFADSVERFEGNGRLERVRTELGDDLEASFSVVGIGVEPNAELWPFERAKDGGIPVDATLRTEVPGVYVAGDLASHDHPIFGRIRTEHYDNAIKSGEAAARNMLGAAAPFDDPHWFWSDQYDVQVQMVGRVPEDAQIVLRGSYEDRSFCAFALDGGGVLRAATSIDWKRDVRRAIKLVQQQVKPDPAALADPDVDIRGFLDPG